MLYSLIMDANSDKFGSSCCRDFLAVKGPHTKTTMTNVLDIFTHPMEQFQNNVAEKKTFVEFAIHQQTEAMYWSDLEHILSKDPVSASSSAPAVASSEPSADQVVSGAARDPSMRPKRDI